MDKLREILIGHLSVLIKDKSVLKAFEKVSREDFVPEELKEYAYLDKPLPIGEEATISQPTTVAIMTEALEVDKGHKVLEIGTGSGYQAAILSKLVGPGKVYTVEINKTLAKRAKETLKSYKNIQVFSKDGSEGLPEQAPFDRIIVTAGAPEEPLSLLDQLTDPGIMLVPVGVGTQILKKYIKDKMVVVEDLGVFAFVPLKKT